MGAGTLVLSPMLEVGAAALLLPSTCISSLASIVDCQQGDDLSERVVDVRQ